MRDPAEMIELSERFLLAAKELDFEQTRSPFELIEEGFLWILTKPPMPKWIPLTPATMTRPQRKLYFKVKELYLAGKPIRLRILKARQMGFSTLIQALMFSFTVIKRMSSLVVANTSQNSEWLFQMSKHFHERMKMHGSTMLPDLKRSTLKMIALEGSEAEMHHATSESPNLGTTRTMGGVHLSEYAFYAHPAMLMTKLMASIPFAPGTMAYVETTANGNNIFYDDWMDEEAAPGSTGFENFFFGWTEHDEYRLPLDGPLPPQSDKEIAEYELELREIHHCDDEQINWFRERLREYRNNLPAFWEQFPAKPMEAFRTSGAMVFYGLKRTLTAASLAAEREHVQGHFSTRFVESAPFIIKVFEKPISGVAYGVGVDVAEGLTWKQRQELEASGKRVSTAKTSSTASVRRADTGQVVATMKSQEPVGLFAEQLFHLGKWYNNALVGVECNNAGHAVIDWLLIHGYPNLYRNMERDPADDMRYQHTRDWGWETKTNTKDILESHWEEFIRANPALIGSPEIAKEALTHVVLDTKRHGPMRGCFNDLLFADMICVQMIESIKIGNYGGATPGELLNKVMSYYRQVGLMPDDSDQFVVGSYQ